MTPVISVVIPARDEAGNIAALLTGIRRVLADFDHQVIVVDDASNDDTLGVLQRFAESMPELLVISHVRACGQSAAIRTGVLAASGSIIATLDADGQNPPENLLPVLTPLIAAPSDGDLGLVQGQRLGRKDTLSRKLASRAANWIRATLLQDGVSDSGCGLKAFRRDVYLNLPYFDHIHRFMPAMVRREGWRIEVVAVTHAERLCGHSKYSNLQRAVVGVADLLGTAWLICRRKLPQIRAPGLLEKPCQTQQTLVQPRHDASAAVASSPGRAFEPS